MSAQAVARLFASDDICPECRQICDLMRLVVLVRDREGEERHQTWEGCWECFVKEDQSLELTEEIQTKDVIKLHTAAQRRGQNKKARRREECAGEDIGGRRVAGSGSQEAKGDARNDCWMVEDKHTTGRGLTLSRETMSKAVGQASKTGRNAVIRVGLADGTELAICLWSDFAEEVANE